MRNAGTTTRTTHLQGISFPFQQEAVDALKALEQKKLTYIQLVSKRGNWMKHSMEHTFNTL